MAVTLGEVGNWLRAEVYEREKCTPHILLGKTTLRELLETRLLSYTKHPVWAHNSTGGVLKYDGEVIRVIKGKNRASEIIKILDAFEEQGWPESISLATSKRKGRAYADKLHNHLKSLRKDMKRLYFGGDYTSEGVYWKVLSDPAT